MTIEDILKFAATIQSGATPPPSTCDYCKGPILGPAVCSTQSTCCSNKCSLAWAFAQQRRYKWVDSRVVKELPKEQHDK